jgi:hypothetical protein
MPSPSPIEIAADPRWLAHSLDPTSDRVTLLRMTEADYRAASFLDQRLLGPQTQTSEIGWAELAAALPADARRDAQYIFHIGHVGSTLISRLLGELDGVFALREPLLLRSFVEMRADVAAARIPTLQALLSRTFAPDQRALVKATSFTSEIADRVLPTGSRALFLYADPRRYIESILAGDNSRRELAMLAPIRAQRIASRVPALATSEASRSEEMLVAQAWACEMTSLEQAAAAMPAESVLWIDFDNALADPGRMLGLLTEFFGIAAAPDTLRAIARGPLLGRYSKALEFEYSPRLRRDLLAQTGREHGAAIREALGWLAASARGNPLLEAALNRAS